MAKLTLKRARQAAGYTQQSLSERMKVSRVTVCKWETGKSRMRAPELYMFCCITGFSEDDILLP